MKAWHSNCGKAHALGQRLLGRGFNRVVTHYCAAPPMITVLVAAARALDDESSTTLAGAMRPSSRSAIAVDLRYPRCPRRVLECPQV